MFEKKIEPHSMHQSKEASLIAEEKAQSRAAEGSPCAEQVGSALQSPAFEQSRLRGVIETLDGLELRLLDDRLMEEVAQLEQRCYPHPWSRNLICGEFQKPISFRFGLLSEDSVAAYCFTYIIPDEMHVLNLAVDPQHRGKGWGRLLFCYTLLQAIDRGVRSIHLEVRPTNEIALALYSSLGFRRVAVRRNYYRDNGEDALLLERCVGPADRSYFRRLSGAKAYLLENVCV